MAGKDQEGFDLGLSDEEKADLESMISDFSADRTHAPNRPAGGDPLEQVAALQDKIYQLSDIVIKINKRIDAFYDIIRLIHQKSEIMNRRIDALIGHGGDERADRK
ncbi:MAG: hypothetical protein LJE94_03195 [Deltaproteobacteria bacterium]|jgi:hypothetical protein|nr:hypothetical protein [Deltaproteobacteria bacterium]